jgi:cytoskeletal protein CcmA (bactofilin family)
MFGSKGKSIEPSVLGSGVVIEGSVRVEGPIFVNGRIIGVLIVDGEASIGPTGLVLGDIVADDLTVGGRIEGNVSVRNNLHVTRTGVLVGNARYGSLEVDRGGILMGSTVQGEDTISLEADADGAGAMVEPMPA